MQQYFEEFSAWASKLQDPQTGNTFAEILDGQIGEHRYVLVPSSCLRLCSNAEPDREALSSDCPSGCISLKSVGCVWYMPCTDVAGVCAPNDRHRVEALRSFLQDDQPAEMRGSGGSSNGYDPMRSSELDHPSDSSALASEEQHAAAAVSQQRSLGPESAEVEDDAPVDDQSDRHERPLQRQSPAFSGDPTGHMALVTVDSPAANAAGVDVRKGDLVEVVGVASANWWTVRVGDRSGFVSPKFLQVVVDDGVAAQLGAPGSLDPSAEGNEQEHQDGHEEAAAQSVDETDETDEAEQTEQVDRQTRQEAHQTQEAVDNEGDEAEETEQAQGVEETEQARGAEETEQAQGAQETENAERQYFHSEKRQETKVDNDDCSDDGDDGSDVHGDDGAPQHDAVAFGSGRALASVSSQHDESVSGYIQVAVTGYESRGTGKEQHIVWLLRVTCVDRDGEHRHEVVERRYSGIHQFNEYLRKTPCTPAALRAAGGKWAKKLPRG